MTCQWGRFTWKFKSQFGEFPFDRWFLGSPDVAEQQVLIGRQADLKLIGLHNLAQPFFHRTFQSSAHHR